MTLGGMALILGLVWKPLGGITAPLVYPFVMFTIRMVEWVSLLPIQPIFVGDLHLAIIWLYYGFLLLISFKFPFAAILKPVLTESVSLSGLIIGVIIVWRLVFSAPDGRLKIDFINVGMGSAILLESPSGKRVLINGGPSARSLSDGLGRRLPPFKRDLDLLLVTSPITQDLDALGEVLPRYRPDQIIWMGGPGLCWEAEYLRGKIADFEIPLLDGEVGQELVFQDGLTIRILAVNPRGGTVLIGYGYFLGLFPFGITEQTREEFNHGKDLGRISVYMVAENGYQTSNPSNWIDNLHPQLLLLPVGIKDNQGLPDRGLLDRLAGYSLLRTDQHGTIQLATDGERLWIELEREP
jgi:competence protein ComEC